MSDTPSCVIHFEGKGGIKKALTDETLAKIVEIRREWINLSEQYGDFTTIAERSFTFIPENVQDIGQLRVPYEYHLTCYRKFTDISKLERARKTLANRTEGRDKDDTEDVAPPEKLRRKSTRQSLGYLSGSSNILPKQCLICKKSGPMYITDKVWYCFYQWSAVVLLVLSSVENSLLTKNPSYTPLA